MAKLMFASDLARYLKEQHGIDLTDSALRKHYPSMQKPLEPILRGDQTSIGAWVFSTAQADRFAKEYKEAKQNRGHLGKSGRKRKIGI